MTHIKYTTGLFAIALCGMLGTASYAQDADQSPVQPDNTKVNMRDRNTN